MSERKSQKLSRVYEMPDLAAQGQIVSEAEMDFFMEHGFLVKRGVLDTSKVDAAMDHLWSHVVENVPVLEGSEWRLSRKDPDSWMNPQWAPMPPHPTSGRYEGRQPIEHYGRIVKLHDIGDADYLLELLPNDRDVRAIVETILGPDLRPSLKTRGVYLVFPTGNPDDPSGSKRLTGASLGPHVDQVCQQLNACAYLDDVPPRCGGFTVYPGSHKLMFRAHACEANWSPLPTFRETLQKVVDEIEPYELVAEKGCVIFWHGRMVHSVGVHIGTRIRWALFADFTQNRAVMSDEEHRELGQYEWFKNAKLFRDDARVSDDMWRNWRLGAVLEGTDPLLR